MPRLLGGFVSPSLRWWSPWWWPLVHLCSFRCRLLDGSLYTLSSQIANQDNTDTTKTIANTSIRRRVATTRLRHKDSGHHSHGHAAPRPHPGTSRPRHDGHVQGRHDIQGTTATPRHGHSHAMATTATTGTDMIAYKGTCPRNTTRHAKTQSYRRSNVAPCNKHPRGGVSPRRKKQGRWLSSADAECSLEHFWITRYLRSLHIFSGCNRFCTLHIVYNVPWIDVDGGRAQLGSASISGCYHSLRVA